MMEFFNALSSNPLIPHWDRDAHHAQLTTEEWRRAVAYS